MKRLTNGADIWEGEPLCGRGTLGAKAGAPILRGYVDGRRKRKKKPARPSVIEKRTAKSRELPAAIFGLPAKIAADQRKKKPAKLAPADYEKRFHIEATKEERGIQRPRKDAV